MVAANFEVVKVVEDVEAAVAVELLTGTPIGDQTGDVPAVQTVLAVLESVVEQIEVGQVFVVSRLNAFFVRTVQ